MSKTRLKAFATIIAGQSPESSDVRELDTGRPFVQGNAEFGTRYPHPVWECDTAPKVARPDDILISVRAPVGAINVARSELGIGRGLAAVRANNNHVQAWLYWALQSEVSELEAQATGSTFSAVSASDIGNLRFALPEPVKISV